MAHFRTAYDQREIPVDVKVAENLKVGDMVVVANDTITKTTTLANATHIVAQSDMTMGYGHVPVELRDHRYNPAVAASTTKKKVALYQIIDKTDILLDTGETKE